MLIPNKYKIMEPKLNLDDESNNAAAINAQRTRDDGELGEA
jgi:hypothetical protein